MLEEEERGVDGGWGVEKRVSLTVRKQSLTAFAPASAAKTTLEFLTANARWSQDEFIRAMHNAKGGDYHIAAALRPR